MKIKSLFFIDLFAYCCQLTNDSRCLFFKYCATFEGKVMFLFFLQQNKKTLAF